MGKAVKKIATVAAVAAAAYYGGGALAASMSGGTAATAAGVGHLGTAGVATFYGGATAAAGTGAGIFGSSLISKVGLGLQGVSYMQQRKFASAQARATKQAAEEQRRINQMQERVRLVQERRQRLDIARQARIQQGQMEAGTAEAGLGMQGTSGFLGATGAIQTQATANISEINMASGASTAISRASQRAADFTTAANMASGKQTMYANIGTLGQNIISQKDEIGNIFKLGA
jgi:hypothetical protein